MTLKTVCNYGSTEKSHNSTNVQQPSAEKIDFAFNNLDYDPQVIDFKESLVIRLPEKYRGNRLGHLWSISWVADNIDVIN